jgi:hypothetical protein
MALAQRRVSDALVSARFSRFGVAGPSVAARPAACSGMAAATTDESNSAGPVRPSVVRPLQRGNKKIKMEIAKLAPSNMNS